MWRSLPRPAGGPLAGTHTSGTSGRGDRPRACVLGGQGWPPPQIGNGRKSRLGGEAAHAGSWQLCVPLVDPASAVAARVHSFVTKDRVQGDVRTSTEIWDRAEVGRVSRRYRCGSRAAPSGHPGGATLSHMPGAVGYHTAIPGALRALAGAGSVRGHAHEDPVAHQRGSARQAGPSAGLLWRRPRTPPLGRSVPQARRPR